MTIFLLHTRTHTIISLEGKIKFFKGISKFIFNIFKAKFFMQNYNFYIPNFTVTY